MPPRLRAAITAVSAALCGACARSVPTPAPPVASPVASGPLTLSVVYPPPESGPDSIVARAADVIELWADSTHRIQSRDSTFVLGSLGRGDAALTIDGVPVPVHPSGGWIAWLPLPDDSTVTFDIVGTAAGDTVRAAFRVRRAHRFRAPAGAVWIDTTSLGPTGDRWVRRGEAVRLAVRATPGASVRLVRPDGSAIRFLPDSAPAALSWGALAFDTRPGGATGPTTDRYVAVWQGPLGPDPGPVMAPLPPAATADSAWAWLEVEWEGRRARVRWPLRLGVVPDLPPPVVAVDDDTARTGLTDGLVAGRPAPYGTYHWFFPNGTAARVSGRWNGQVRLQLSRTAAAWVNADEVVPLAPGTPPPGGTARSMRLHPAPESAVLRVPLPARVPFRVDEASRALTLTLYGVQADMDWIQYGGADPFVRLISFAQPEEDVAVVRVDLDAPVWGYRTRWEGNHLLLEVRRPPAIDPASVLRGRRIALDAGHPPGGTRGPTGTREADVVLAVVRKARALLEREGATVLLTRDTDSSLGLAERTRLAEAEGAEVLISVHANALPDGVNPFVNSGTSVYYFHPRSVSLARALDRALVGELGSRDLGIGRGDLALVRPTWMPAALVEGLFLILPEQEAVLVSEEGQWRYARGVVAGLAAFLREVATQGR